MQWYNLHCKAAITRLNNRDSIKIAPKIKKRKKKEEKKVMKRKIALAMAAVMTLASVTFAMPVSVAASSQIVAGNLTEARNRRVLSLPNFVADGSVHQFQNNRVRWTTAFSSSGRTNTNANSAQVGTTVQGSYLYVHLSQIAPVLSSGAHQLRSFEVEINDMDWGFFRQGGHYNFPAGQGFSVVTYAPEAPLVSPYRGGTPSGNYLQMFETVFFDGRMTAGGTPGLATPTSVGSMAEIQALIGAANLHVPSPGGFLAPRYNMPNIPNSPISLAYEIRVDWTRPNVAVVTYYVGLLADGSQIPPGSYIRIPVVGRTGGGDNANHLALTATVRSIPGVHSDITTGQSVNLTAVVATAGERVTAFAVGGATPAPANRWAVIPINPILIHENANGIGDLRNTHNDRRNEWANNGHSAVAGINAPSFQLVAPNGFEWVLPNDNLGTWNVGHENTALPTPGPAGTPRPTFAPSGSLATMTYSSGTPDHNVRIVYAPASGYAHRAAYTPRPGYPNPDVTNVDRTRINVYATGFIPNVVGGAGQSPAWIQLSELRLAPIWGTDVAELGTHATIVGGNQSGIPNNLEVQVLSFPVNAFDFHVTTVNSHSRVMAGDITRGANATNAPGAGITVRMAEEVPNSWLINQDLQLAVTDATGNPIPGVTFSSLGLSRAHGLDANNNNSPTFTMFGGHVLGGALDNANNRQARMNDAANAANTAMGINPTAATATGVATVTNGMGFAFGTNQMATFAPTSSAWFNDDGTTFTIWRMSAPGRNVDHRAALYAHVNLSVDIDVPEGTAIYLHVTGGALTHIQNMPAPVRLATVMHPATVEATPTHVQVGHQSFAVGNIVISETEARSLTRGIALLPSTDLNQLRQPRGLTVTVTEFDAAVTDVIRFNPVGTTVVALQNHITTTNGLAVRVVGQTAANRAIDLEITSASNNGAVGTITLHSLHITLSRAVHEGVFGVLLSGSAIIRNSIWAGGGTSWNTAHAMYEVHARDRFLSRGVAVDHYFTIGIPGLGEERGGVHLPLSFSATTGTIAIMVGAELLELSAPIINDAGNLLIPLRAILEIWGVGSENIGSHMQPMGDGTEVRVGWARLGNVEAWFFADTNLISINGGLIRPMINEHGNPITVNTRIITQEEAVALNVEAAADRMYVPMRGVLNAFGVSNDNIDTSAFPIIHVNQRDR
jgi:hypothetical protein